MARIKRNIVKLVLAQEYFDNRFNSFYQIQGQILKGYKVGDNNYCVQSDPKRNSYTWMVDIRYVKVLAKPIIVICKE